jgi:hypothetical protein
MAAVPVRGTCGVSRATRAVCSGTEAAVAEDEEEEGDDGDDGDDGEGTKKWKSGRDTSGYEAVRGRRKRREEEWAGLQGL